MADNTLLNAGTGGDTSRSKDRSGVKTQVVGLDLNVGGSETLLSTGQKTAANSIPVVLPSDQVVSMKELEAFTPITGTLTNTSDAITFAVPQGTQQISVATSTAGSLPNMAINVFVSMDGGSNYTLNAVGSIGVTLANAAVTDIAIGGGVTNVRLFCSGSSGVAVNIIATATRGNNVTRTQGTQQISGVVSQIYGVVSGFNSRSTLLGASAVFTGTGELVSDYSSIIVSVATDQASALNGLSIQQSTDGTNWDFLDNFTLPAGATKTYNVPVQAQYFRVVLTNGTTAQTFLRLQTIFCRNTKRGSSLRPQDGRDNENDVEEIAAYLSGYNGTAWDRLRSSIANGLQVDPTRNAPDLSVGPTAITTQNLVPAGAATANSAVTLVMGSGQRGATIQVTGTYTGALSVQGTVDGTTWVTLGGNVLSNLNTNALSATIASATQGMFQVEVAGLAQIRVTALAAVTGTATVTIKGTIGAGVMSIDNTLTVAGSGTFVVDSEMPAAAVLADNTANPTTPTVGATGLLYNGTTHDRARGNWNVNTGDTGAKTATGNGATQTNYDSSGAVIVFNVGAVSGTTPTMVLKLQGSSDGGTTFYDLPNAATVSITATGVYVLSVYPGVTVAANAAVSHPMPRTWRVVWTIGGTTPSFAITNIQVGYVS